MNQEIIATEKSVKDNSLSPQIKSYLEQLDEEEQESDKMYLRYPALF